jgi:hypothetical protein
MCGAEKKYCPTLRLSPHPFRLFKVPIAFESFIAHLSHVSVPFNNGVPFKIRSQSCAPALGGTALCISCFNPAGLASLDTRGLLSAPQHRIARSLRFQGRSRVTKLGWSGSKSLNSL